MTYNGIELTLQLTNATFAERYETALHKAHRDAEAAGKAKGATLAQTAPACLCRRGRKGKPAG